MWNDNPVWYYIHYYCQNIPDQMHATKKTHVCGFQSGWKNFKEFTLIQQNPRAIHHHYNLHKSQDTLYVNVNRLLTASRHKTCKVVTSSQRLLNQQQKKKFLFELLSTQMMRWISERNSQSRWFRCLIQWHWSSTGGRNLNQMVQQCV